MEAVFWCALVLVLYVYLLYPVLLACWAWIAPRPVASGNDTPKVTIVVAVRNEAGRLAARLDNLLTLDYPREARQIVVVSDGSRDDTEGILRRYRGSVEAISLPPGGKARALNAGVARARHDVLVFTDARQRFARDALRRLVAPLADPSVGGVSGELILDTEAMRDRSGIGEGLGGYWRYEKWLRRQESRVGSTMGATGAIYALRRSLWRPLPDDTILDDVLAPMRAVLAARRVVFEAGACAFDSPAASPTELRRKVRTLAGNFQILCLEPRLLNPFANPVWVQYLSHKVGRLIVPYALLALLIASAVLAPRSSLYAAAFAGQLAFYALAAYGAYLDHCDRRRSAPGAPDLSPHHLTKGSRTP